MNPEVENQESETDEKPLCANWQVWMGKEVEGESEREMLTLFVRKNLTQRDLDMYFASYCNACAQIGQKDTRIWFTKDFATWQVFRYAKTLAHIVCLEVEIIEYFPHQRTGRKLPFNLFYGVQLYVKIPIQLNKGAHVCIGYDFEDESFRIGDGRKVRPSDYRNDVQLA